MAVIDTGDRMLTMGGRPTWLARPSVPVGLFSGRSGAVRLVDGKPISYERIYRTQPWVAAAVNLLVRQISRLPLKSYRMQADGQRTRLRSPHPVVALLESGAPTRLKQQVALGLLVQGNAVFWKGRRPTGAPPAALRHLDWRLLEPQLTRDETHILFWRWTGDSELGIPEFLGPEDVVHFKWEAPDGPIGISPLEQLGVTIRGEEAAQRYQQNTLGNGGNPRVAVTMAPEVRADDANTKLFMAMLAEEYAGPENAGKPWVLGGGVQDVKTLTQTAVEAELIEQRKVARTEVAAVYQAPPPLIGDLEHATYSNIEELHRILYVTTLGPPLTLIAETLRADVILHVPAWRNIFCEFDLAEVLKGDMKERLEAYQLAIRNGIKTVNEVRQLENDPKFTDVPAADAPLVQANNMRRLEDLDKPAPAPPAAPPGPGNAPDPDPDEPPAEGDPEPDDA